MLIVILFFSVLILSGLILSGDTDDRVDPAHSRKFAATLQEKGLGGTFLLRTEKKAGHTTSSTDKYITIKAYQFAFLNKVLGLKD